MSDKDKIYYYEKLLNMTIESYKEMVKDAERILSFTPDDNILRTRITAYNDIIKVLTTILNKLEV